MKYDFLCEKCKEIVEREIPVSKSSEPQYCEKCKTQMKRMYSAPSIKTSDGYKK